MSRCQRLRDRGHEIRRGQGRGNDRLGEALERLAESRLEERLIALAGTARRPAATPAGLNGSEPA